MDDKNVAFAYICLYALLSIITLSMASTALDLTLSIPYPLTSKFAHYWTLALATLGGTYCLFLFSMIRTEQFFKKWDEAK